jgi:hypothetical protein
MAGLPGVDVTRFGRRGVVPATVTGDASVGGAETPCVGLALRPPDTQGWPVGERWSESAHTHDQTEVV